MARPTRAVALLAAAIVALPALVATGPAAAGPLEDSHAIPIPVAQLDLDVAVVLAGVSLTAGEKEALRTSVGDTWVPFVVPTGFPTGIEYAVDLRVVETSSAFDAALSQAINGSFGNDTLGRFVGNYPGLLENLTAAFPSVQQSTPVPHADADEVLAWLAAADDAFPELAAGPDETRLLFLNPTGVDVPYYYRIDSMDSDSGLNLTFETANAWGGTDGIYFQDLRAAPNHVGEGSTQGRPANFAGQPPLWSYGSSGAERSRLVADLAHYVNTSIRILAAPSYAVTPFFPADYTLNVTLFDGTAGQDLFAPGGSGSAFGIDSPGRILNAGRVEQAVADLFPMAPIHVVVHTANRAAAPTVGAAVTANTDLGPTSGLLIDPFGLNSDLKATFGVPSNPVLPGDSVTLPVLMIVLDNEAWVQAPGTRGATLQRSDGRAASIIIAAGVEQVATRGFTDTLIHETGHSLGLGHPHELPLPAGTPGGDLYVDWLRDLSSTPMTYLPSYVDYTFDSFDKRAVASGAAATTLAAAFLARQQAYAALDTRGYSNATLPASTANSESLFATFANQALASMEAGNFYTAAGISSAASGALVAAKRAYDQASDMLIDAVLKPRCCGDNRPSGAPGPDAAMALVALAAVAVVASARRARRRQ